MSKQREETNAARYEWLRSHLEFINFDGLTCDTCDIGLDYAIDKNIDLLKKDCPCCGYPHCGHTHPVL
jgi:hypothetical protein